MLQLKCDRCGQQLDRPGALLFSPPQGDGWLVEKHHLCVECYAVVVAQLQASDAKDPLPRRS